MTRSVRSFSPNDVRLGRATDPGDGDIADVGKDQTVSNQPSSDVAQQDPVELVRQGVEKNNVGELMSEEEVASFNGDDDGARWRSERLSSKRVGAAWMIMSERTIEQFTSSEALRGPNRAEWTRAMQEEIDALKRYGTWRRRIRLRGRNAVKTKWVYMVK